MSTLNTVSDTEAGEGKSRLQSRFKIRNLRWWIAGLLFLVAVINYVDRQALSIVAPILTEEFHLSNQDYAFVVNVFLVTYALMQLAAWRRY